MVCKNCNIKPVITLTNNNVRLCKNCFIRYFERKVLRTIAKYKLIDKKDDIAVAVSSGKDSFTAMYILNMIAEKKKSIRVRAIAIDEGIEVYRNLNLLKKYCKERKIELYIHSFKDEFNCTLDEMLKKTKLNACSICGVLRRFLLNSKARELGASKLATGHNLDDEAQSILMNQFKGNLERSSRLGPITGVVKDKRFIPRIKPLYFMTEKEVTIYAFLREFPIKFNECPNSYNSLRSDVRDHLNKLEQKHPGSKHAVINSFLEVLPVLKEIYKDSKIKACKICDEPCSSEICNVCSLLGELKLSLRN